MRPVQRILRVWGRRQAAIVTILAFVWAGWHLAARLVSLPGWTAAYLDDLLCLPLVLGLILGSQRLLSHRPGWTLPLAQGLIAWAVFSVWFEWLLPRFAARFTGDPRDVAAYLVGFLFFQLVINRPAGEPSGSSRPLATT